MRNPTGPTLGRAFSRTVRDLHDAVRGLRAGRGVTGLAFCLLTLTIAAGTVTFSVEACCSRA